jgi:hypothetical protein
MNEIILLFGGMKGSRDESKEVENESNSLFFFLNQCLFKLTS